MPPTKHVLACDRCDGKTEVMYPTASDMVFKRSVIPVYKRTRRCLDCGSLMTMMELRVLNLLPYCAKESVANLATESAKSRRIALATPPSLTKQRLGGGLVEIK